MIGTPNKKALTQDKNPYQKGLSKRIGTRSKSHQARIGTLNKKALTQIIGIPNKKAFAKRPLQRSYKYFSCNKCLPLPGSEGQGSGHCQEQAQGRLTTSFVDLFGNQWVLPYQSLKQILKSLTSLPFYLTKSLTKG